MQTLRCVKRTRYFFSTAATAAPSALMKSPSTVQPATIRADDVVSSFKNWFISNKNPLYEQIYDILNTQDNEKERLLLSQLNLRVTETLVLDVLRYGNGKNVLACLKFFDWAGRQKAFQHTRSTHMAIFKILSNAKLKSVMLDFLKTYGATVPGGAPRVNYYSTLVMGYAVIGKPEIALNVFGKMRFHGINMDSFAYHVLLNACVEERFFDAVDMVLKEIKLSGYECDITHSIMIKALCKQRKLDKAKAYVNRLIESGVKRPKLCVSFLIQALCKNRRYEEADILIKKFEECGSVSMHRVYDGWVKDLVIGGDTDKALEILKTKRHDVGYVPDLYRYNMLLYRLLSENRTEQVYELLCEMEENNVRPNEATLGSILCFLCKVGMLESALMLFKSSSELGYLPNAMSHTFIINTLCGEGRAEEAYGLFRDPPRKGYFPRRNTFYILGDALCREGKINQLKELLFTASRRGMNPSVSTYDKLITAICKAKSVADMCFIESERAQLNLTLSERSYTNLIRGFERVNRGDIAAKLLIEFQEKGFKPMRHLFRSVISSFWNLGDPGNQFKVFFSMQLSLCKDECKADLFHSFIDAAGYAGKPELSRKVYDIMKSNGVKQTRTTDILLLRSFLWNEKISEACKFFSYLWENDRIGKKICATMLVWLCKADRVSHASQYFKIVRQKGVSLTLQCYEELILCMCKNNLYKEALYIVDDMIRVRRTVSSYVGNVLLQTSFKSRDLYNTWIELAKQGDNDGKGIFSIEYDKLCELLGGFCFYIQTNTDIIDLEETIEQCYPLDVYTYNFLMNIFCYHGLFEDAVRVFTRISEKGLEPNRLSFELLARGFQRYGHIEEAEEIRQEMLRVGFDDDEHRRTTIGRGSVWGSIE